MLRLSAGSRRLSGTNFRSTGPRQQITDDRNCSDDNAERSTSADWRTAGTDDQKRRRLVCSCSPGTAEPFHEDIDTTIQQHGELESYSVCDVEPVHAVTSLSFERLVNLFRLSCFLQDSLNFSSM